MKDTVTITSKGQTTIPAAVRRQLGLGKNGGVLQMTFNKDKDELIISKPLSIGELSDKISSFVKTGKKPLVDVDTFYQTNRFK